MIVLARCALLEASALFKPCKAQVIAKYFPALDPSSVPAIVYTFSMTFCHKVVPVLSSTCHASLNGFGINTPDK